MNVQVCKWDSWRFGRFAKSVRFCSFYATRMHRIFLLEVMPFTGARRYQTSPGPANAYYLQCFLDETYYVDIVVATDQRGSGQVGSLSTKYPVHRPPSLLQSVQIELFRQG